MVIRNSEMTASDTEEKAERLDVNCRIDDDSQIDVEMQSSRIEEESAEDHQNLKGKGIYCCATCIPRSLPKESADMTGCPKSIR